MAQQLAQSPSKPDTLGQVLKALQGYGAYRGMKSANEATKTNQKIQSDEMQQMVRALQGEPALGMMKPGEMPSFQSPDVSNLAAQLQIREATKEPPKPTVVGKNARLVGADGSTIVDAVPESPDLPDEAELFNFMQSLPADQHAGFMQFLQDQQARGTTVNVGGDDPFKDFTGSVLSSMQENAVGATQRMQEAEMGLNLLHDRVMMGNETGKWAPLQTEAAAWLGVNPEGVSSAQTFDALMGNRVMSRIQQTKGAVSEKEMGYFKQISPGSDKDPLTNYALLEIDRRAAYREQDKMKYAQDYLQQNGNMVGFDQWYMKNKDPFPAFDIGEIRRSYQEQFMSNEYSPQSVVPLVDPGRARELEAKYQ